MNISLTHIYPLRGIFTLAAVCCLSNSLSAQESQTAYNFLRLPVSAHAAALGSDNISLIEDDEALVFHNPALLCSVSDKTIDLNFMNYMSGSNVLSASFNKIIKQKASVAFSAQYIDYGEMKETDENNVSTGNFTAKDIAIGATFSYLLSNHIAGGITAKIISSYIGDYNSFAMAVDLGINYYDEEHGWSLSLVTKNLGGQLKPYDDNYDKMPIDVQLGASRRLINTPFRFHVTMVDLNHWDDKFINHFVGGVDVLVGQNIWFGGGYNWRRSDEMSISDSETESSHGAGFSLGAGLNLERFKLNLAWGKYHVSSSSILINVAYSL